MQLTQFSDYALRVLIFVALRDDDGPATLAEISRAYDISHNHLMKVVKPLVANGFLESVRGRSGGLLLGLPAREINIGAVVRSTEESFALVECLRGSGGQCRIERCCRLKGVMQEALAAFLAVLDRYTLEEMIEPDASLRELLFPQTGSIGQDFTQSV